MVGSFFIDNFQNYTRNRSLLWVLSLAGLLAALLMSYFNCFGHDFILDDSLYFNNPLLTQISLQGLFSKVIYEDFYRPVMLLLFKGEFFLFGQNKAAYHVLNFVLFYGTAVLFLFILWKLTNNLALSFWSVLIYSIHPLNSFLLDYKTASYLILCTLFMQISLLFFMYYLEYRSAGTFIGTLFFQILSFLTHEVSVILPLYFFLIMHYMKNYRFRAELFICLPYFLLSIAYLLFRWHIFSLAGAEQHMMEFEVSLGQKLATLQKLMLWYLSQIVVPWKVLFIWHEKVEPVFNIFRISLFLLPFIVLMFAFIFKKRSSVWFLGLAIFISGFIPAFVGSFVNSKYLPTAMIEPHWFQFSSIGIFMFIGSVLIFLKDKFNFSIWAGCILSLLLFYVITTIRINNFYKNEVTYCQYWIKTNPLDGAPWVKIANRMGESKADLRKFIEGLNEILFLNSSEIVFANRAGVYFNMGDYRSAVMDYTRSLELDPKFFRSYLNRGNAYLVSRNFDEAKADYSKALEINPRSFHSYWYRGNIFFQEQNYSLALQDFDNALRLRPNSPEVSYHRDLVLGAMSNK